MHMADALVSPAVGGIMWAVSASAVAYCSKKVKEHLDERKVPFMGVLGAFVFAAQMINFTIPGTGSSGHLGGGLLLAVLLGPHAAFLVVASVLVVQALFFADGGLLALGCNIFNLGFFPAFIAYPLIYRRIVKGGVTFARLTAGTTVAAVIGLELGALGVVVETIASGISALPFATFLMLMLPIHLAIGLAEGFVTASIVSFIWKANPQILQEHCTAAPSEMVPTRYLAGLLLAAALITGGFVSWFASENPDGLEWSISKAQGQGEPKRLNIVHDLAVSIQDRTALFPDYSFRPPATEATEGSRERDKRVGTSASGIIGGLITLCLALLLGFFLKKFPSTGKMRG